MLLPLGKGDLELELLPFLDPEFGVVECIAGDARRAFVRKLHKGDVLSAWNRTDFDQIGITVQSWESVIRSTSTSTERET